jgi:phosphoglycolate phosphatase
MSRSDNAPVLVLMDIDGTMIRWHRGISQKIVRHVLEEGLGVHVPPEFHADLGGKTDFQIIGECCVKLGVHRTVLQERRAEILQEITAITTAFAQKENMIAMNGVHELMQACQAEGYTLGLLTGNIRATAFAKLQPNAFDRYFADGAFGDDHEDRIQLPPIALARFNAVKSQYTFERMVIIGDTDNDIRCAKPYGIPVITVATGSMTREELEVHSPSAVLDSLADTDNVLGLIRNFCLS